jgi:hypothetical protein
MNSMLSLGSVAFDAGGAEIDALQINLEPLPEATPDPRTMDWWKGQPEAWAAARVDQEPPEQAMVRYAGWVDDLPGRRHSHVAIDDAREQGELFFNIRKALSG